MAYTGKPARLQADGRMFDDVAEDRSSMTF